MRHSARNANHVDAVEIAHDARYRLIELVACSELAVRIAAPREHQALMRERQDMP